MTLNLSWNARLPCSDTARIRCDDLLGSAAPTNQWLLIEHPGPWPLNAVDLLSSAVRQQLLAPVAGRRLRLLLIRQPGKRYHRGRDQRSNDLRWGVLTQGQGQTWGRWAKETDLLAAREAIVSGGQPAHPLILVCAHGIHDQCCAVRGRPVAATLAATWPEYAWECTHLGGDRFAPNVLLAPDGVYYGQLDRDCAVDVVRRHLDGQIDVDKLRGFTHLSAPAQVAAAEVHRRQGAGGWDDVAVRGLHRLTPNSWRVTLTSKLSGPADVAVGVTRDFGEPAVLTCKAASPDAGARFSVSSYVSL